ncbi:Hypothetical protein HDN1F_13490 [gamma proteobacterium HdN1]|nr:Hypothetical protein HDN1F_13490 [gamma proteobacterium HdN1]
MTKQGSVLVAIPAAFSRCIRFAMAIYPQGIHPMTKPAKLLSIAALPLLCCANLSHAALIEGLSIGVEGSTLGIGGSINFQANDFLSADLAYHRYSTGQDSSTEDTKYKGDIELDNFSAKFNLHPFAGGFHVALGAVMGDINVTAVGSSNAQGEFKFNDHTYTAADVGKVHGKVDLKESISPYLGIGYRSQYQGLGFLIDLGVLSAKTKTSLRADGPIAENETFQTDLAKERKSLEDDAADFDWYPVVSIGLHYRF